MEEATPIEIPVDEETVIVLPGDTAEELDEDEFNEEVTVVAVATDITEDLTPTRETEASLLEDARKKA